ncbi:MAG: ribosome maturation factor RimP [Actinomycetota bacterium]|nr:ribosome maturation factor RimP [Actinomycetota bacterium]MDQ6948270.1 ribosome maturation factor RimP [Actinomycetota bacterium]
MTSPAQSIGELVEPLVGAAGLELWDVEVNPRAVRVLVDRPGGVDLESLTDLARVVSAALDGREQLTPGSQYQLEVSSPGVERALRTPSHYERYVGTTVMVKTEAPIDGSRRLEGVLLAADTEGITLDLPTGAMSLRYHQIQKARTVLVWGPPAQTRVAKGAPRSKPMKADLMKDASR